MALILQSRRLSSQQIHLPSSSSSTFLTRQLHIQNLFLASPTPAPHFFTSLNINLFCTAPSLLPHLNCVPTSSMPFLVSAGAFLLTSNTKTFYIAPCGGQEGLAWEKGNKVLPYGIYIHMALTTLPRERCEWRCPSLNYNGTTNPSPQCLM